MKGEERLTAVSELNLIRRAKAGDKEAFIQLYREHAGHIYATCLRMLADAASAQELAQEAIVRAWQMLATFRGESPFSAWIHRIAVNAVLDHLRKEKRSWVEFTGEPESLERAASDTLGTEERLDLESAIATLPPQARAILILHDIEGYTHEEIAAMMHIVAGTSKAQLHRARQLLKERLER